MHQEIQDGNKIFRDRISLAGFNKFGDDGNNYLSFGTCLQLGGPYIPLKTGRRDGRKSRAEILEEYLPDHNESMSVVLDRFSAIGINTPGVVALLGITAIHLHKHYTNIYIYVLTNLTLCSEYTVVCYSYIAILNMVACLKLYDLLLFSIGAHSVGRTHCVKLVHRLYPEVDPELNPDHVEHMLHKCPDVIPDPKAVQYVRNDRGTPMVLDNNYYRNILDNKGLLIVDHQLAADKRTKPYVKKMAKSQDYFFKEFGRAITILSENNPLTGTKGEIRKQCSVVNKHN